MLKFIRSFKPFRLSYITVYNHTIDLVKYQTTYRSMDISIKARNLSLININLHIMKNIENQKKVMDIPNFDEISLFLDRFNRNLLEDLGSCKFHEKQHIFSNLFNQIKKSDVFHMIFNRFLMLFHKNIEILYEKGGDYEMKMKVFALLINFLSMMIYFDKEISNYYQSISKMLEGIYKNGGILFEFKENLKNVNNLLKSNFMYFLKDNLMVYKTNHMNPLEKFSYNFGNLLYNINEYLLTFDEKLKLSQILISLMFQNQGNMLNLINFEKNTKNQEIFDKNNEFFEKNKNNYYFLTLKQINDFMLFSMKELKDIGKPLNLLEIIRIFRIFNTEIPLDNILYYISHWAINDDKMMKKSEFSRKFSYLIEILEIISNELKQKPKEKLEEEVKFYTKYYEIIYNSLKNPLLDPLSSHENLIRLYNIFSITQVFSLSLLSLLEEKLLVFIQNLKNKEFLQILLFYAESPLYITPRLLTTQIFYYIKKNHYFFNFDTMLTIALSVLQMTYNKKTMIYEIFLYVDSEIWNKMIEKIAGYQKNLISKPQIYKLYKFIKLYQFEGFLKENTYLEEIAKKYEKEFKKLEIRKISEIQRKFENMLIKYKIPYIMEPELINDVFSVDFVINLKGKKIIVEINGPSHYFTVLWKNHEFNEDLIKKMEFSAEYFDNQGVAIMETRFTSLKTEFLTNLGFSVLNLSYLNIVEYEKIEKLYDYFMDFVDLREKRKIKEKYF